MCRSLALNCRLFPNLLDRLLFCITIVPFVTIPSSRNTQSSPMSGTRIVFEPSWFIITMNLKMNLNLYEEMVALHYTLIISSGVNVSAQQPPFRHSIRVSCEPKIRQLAWLSSTQIFIAEARRHVQLFSPEKKMNATITRRVTLLLCTRPHTTLLPYMLSTSSDFLLLLLCIKTSYLSFCCSKVRLLHACHITDKCLS